MLRLVDVNNFFSFTGGGVRTYHLNKLAFFGERDDVEYTLLAPSDRTGEERFGNARMVHVPAPAIPGAPNYRYIVNVPSLRQRLLALRPDVIEVGSPYIAPWAVRAAARDLDAVVIGFWHADYPRAYVQRPLGELHPLLGDAGLNAAWWYARQTYGKYDATFASADCVVTGLWEHGIPRVFQTPLGVDVDHYHPSKRDPELRASVGADDGRPLLFFPHRLLEEKGLSTLIRAWPAIRERHEPVLVFAGVGPGQDKLDAFRVGRPEVHHLGFITDRDLMARWYASADAVFCLSAFETFGLSAAESMAAGNALIAADAGGVREFVDRADCGVLVPYGDHETLARQTTRLLDDRGWVDAGVRARTFAAQHFSWPAAFERMLGFYREIVAAGGKDGLSPEPTRWVTRP